MIFKSFKKYFGENQYFAIYYNKIIDELSIGLQSLRFTENFRCIESETLTLASGDEVAIRHPFAVVPSYWIIVRRTGNSVIADGDTAWNSDFIYLKNVGANSATFKVLIFK